MNPRRIVNESVTTSHSELRAKIKGALSIGFGGRSSLETAYGSFNFGTLEVSNGYLRIASWSSPTYEIRRDLIERLVFREPRFLKGLQIAWLRILHKLSGAPEYVLFVTCNPTELKTALTNAGYEISEPVACAEPPAE